jgi:DNA-binding transcriptional MerR regulator
MATMPTLSTSAAARILGVSKSLVRHYANKGILGVVRDALGRRVIDRDEVERLKKARRAWTAPRRCAFCSSPIAQHQTFCKQAACRLRRQRIRAKRSYHARAQTKGAAKLTRAEHLARAQARALEYLDAGNVMDAYMSFVSDLGKHEDLAGALQIDLGLVGRTRLGGFLDRPADLRRWIEGFA